MIFSSIFIFIVINDIMSLNRRNCYFAHFLEYSLYFWMITWMNKAMQIYSLHVLGALISKNVLLNKVSLKSRKIRNSFQFFILTFKFLTNATKEGNVSSQLFSLISFFDSFMLFQIYLAAWRYCKYHCYYEKISFQFLSRPFYHVWSAKNFVGKDLRIYYRNGLRLFCRSGKCCSWNK